jgi:RNA polymerase sigma factor (TIGR02999 family)
MQHEKPDAINADENHHAIWKYFFEVGGYLALVTAYNPVDSMTTQLKLTELLSAWGDGDQAALEQLMPAIYQELRRLAGRHMARERADHTLQATALVNEAYLRLVDQKRVRWQNRAHFWGVAAQMMRRILVDYARARGRAKRGGGAPVVSLDEAAALSAERASELVAVNDALDRLAALDERKSRVVELRFFGGLSVEETAEVLQVSPNTVMRDWRTAKAWLHRELRDPGTAIDPI